MTVVLTPPSVIHEDRSCIKCGYDINGLPSEGKCPECGTDVATTIKEPLLRYLGPSRMSGIQTGLQFMLAGLGTAIVAALGVFGGFMRSSESGALVALFLIPLFALYSFGWWKMLFALNGSETVDARFRGRFTLPRLLTVAIPTLITPVLMAILAALMNADSYKSTDKVAPFMLALIAISSGSHFLTMSAILTRVARAIDGRPTRKGAASYHVCTLILHGICLPWALLICVALMANSADAIFSIGLVYLFTIPVHAAWLLWTMIHCSRLLHATRIEAKAVPVPAESTGDRA